MKSCMPKSWRLRRNIQWKAYALSALTYLHEPLTSSHASYKQRIYDKPEILTAELQDFNYFILEYSWKNLVPLQLVLITEKHQQQTRIWQGQIANLQSSKCCIVFIPYNMHWNVNCSLLSYFTFQLNRQANIL